MELAVEAPLVISPGLYWGTGEVMTPTGLIKDSSVFCSLQFSSLVCSLAIGSLCYVVYQPLMIQNENNSMSFNTLTEEIGNTS